ncbi:MAG: cytochrome c3 family protein, partial [Aquisalimonadaceae bacterium]
MTTNKTVVWIAWSLVTVISSGYLAYRLLVADDSSIFLLGETTHGHHQIELACDSCHTSAFGGTELLQNACMDCHGAALRAANDTHPRSKFTDPRNADRLDDVDARLCIACHREHKPAMTGAMGVTLPGDFCFHCHQDIAETRPTHQGMGFETCTDAGCHNYHDNRALYEDFLLIHAEAPDFLADAGVLPRASPLAAAASAPLTAADQDAPAEVGVGAHVLDEWARSLHAVNGVNCSDCHSATDGAWVQAPDHSVCADCHNSEVEGFLAGMHGMRLNVGLSAMRPELARRPMRGDAHGLELGCTSCHGEHGFDTVTAAVDACLGCHADEHSLAYLDSPHHRLWQLAAAGDAAPGSGVSCATCHMPREQHRLDGKDVVLVQHNQNSNLRPVEKMARSVCMSCHGLGFTLDALADPALRANNFRGHPAVQIPGIRMAT